MDGEEDEEQKVDSSDSSSSDLDEGASVSKIGDEKSVNRDLPFDLIENNNAWEGEANTDLYPSPTGDKYEIS